MLFNVYLSPLQQVTASNHQAFVDWAAQLNVWVVQWTFTLVLSFPDISLGWTKFTTYQYNMLFFLVLIIVGGVQKEVKVKTSSARADFLCQSVAGSHWSAVAVLQFGVICFISTSLAKTHRLFMVVVTMQRVARRLQWEALLCPLQMCSQGCTPKGYSLS